MSRVEDFLKQYTSSSTRKTYTYALKEFFGSVYGKCEGPELEAFGERYFAERCKYDNERRTWSFIDKEKIEQDIKDFMSRHIKAPPKTRRLQMSAIRTFLRENHVELEEYFWIHLAKTIRGSKAVTQDKVPSTVELRKIITHMPIQGKALYLTLASSGMRIGETLKLELDDLDLNSDPCKVTLRAAYTKSGNKRVTFISREAKEAVVEWLKTRADYIRAASEKSLYRPGYKISQKEFEAAKQARLESEKRLFPFDEATAYAIWKNATRKAGFNGKDKTTKRNEMHPHTLRKFFRTKMAQLVEVDAVEALMGHDGYLTNEYRRYEPEELAKFYQQGEPAVLIFTDAGEIQKVKADLAETKEHQRTIIEGLQAENYNLKEQQRKQQEQIEGQQKDLDDLKDVVEHLMKQQYDQAEYKSNSEIAKKLGLGPTKEQQAEALKKARESRNKK